MADISKIKIESGVYNIKDEVARENLQILNEKIKNVSKFPNFFIGAFFHGGFGTVEKSTAHFYSSIDGVNFSEFSSNINTMTDNWFRDLSLQYDKTNKKFLMASTGYDTTMDCFIMTSLNFTDWEQHKINLGYMVEHNNRRRWAPDLFFDDNGILYLCIAIEKSGTNENHYMEQILYKCNNLQNLTFTRIGAITLNDKTTKSNYIDGTFCKYNNVYYFLVKNENSKSLELYSVNNIEDVTSYSLINEQVQEKGLPLEGGCMVITDNTLNIYAENYSLYHGYSLLQTQLKEMPTIRSSSKWLSTLTNKTYTESPENYDARHGSVLYITDDEAKQIILNNTNISFNRTNAIEIPNKTVSFNFYYGKNPSNVIVYPDLKYNLEALSGTITIDNLINPYNCKELIFIQSTKALTININKINGNEVNIIYRNNGGNKSGITKLDLNSGKFDNQTFTIGTTDVINKRTDLIVSRCTGTSYNGIVQLDFDITVKTVASGYMEIAQLPDRFRPRYYYLPNQYKVSNQEIFISSDGIIACNLSNLTKNEVIRCTATYIANN